MKRTGSTDWKKVKEVLPSVPFNYSLVKEFATGLSDTNTIAEISDFKPFKALEVRIVFTKYTGNVLATKLGVIVNDPKGTICKRECPQCTNFSKCDSCSGKDRY